MLRYRRRAGRPGHYGRWGIVALATFAMMAAYGGIASAPAEMMTAAITGYRCTTARAKTNRPMQTVTEPRKLSSRPDSLALVS